MDQGWACPPGYALRLLPPSGEAWRDWTPRADRGSPWYAVAEPSSDGVSGRTQAVDRGTPLVRAATVLTSQKGPPYIYRVPQVRGGVEELDFDSVPNGDDGPHDRQLSLARRVSPDVASSLNSSRYLKPSVVIFLGISSSKEASLR